MPGTGGIPVARIPTTPSSATSITIPAVGAALLLAVLLAHAGEDAVAGPEEGWSGHPAPESDARAGPRAVSRSQPGLRLRVNRSRPGFWSKAAAGTSVLLMVGCGGGGVDRESYVAKNLEAVAFLEHPTSASSTRHQTRHEEDYHKGPVLVGYVTIVELPRPPNFDPFTYYGRQFARHGWRVGCLETTPLIGSEARALTIEKDAASASVNAGEAVMIVSVDHSGVDPDRAGPPALGWHCSIPPP